MTMTFCTIDDHCPLPFCVVSAYLLFLLCWRCRYFLVRVSCSPCHHHPFSCGLLLFFLFLSRISRGDFSRDFANLGFSFFCWFSASLSLYIRSSLNILLILSSANHRSRFAIMAEMVGCEDLWEREIRRKRRQAETDSYDASLLSFCLHVLIILLRSFPSFFFGCYHVVLSLCSAFSSRSSAA